MLEWEDFLGDQVAVGQLFLSPRSLLSRIRPELRLLSQYLSQRIVGLFATGCPSLLSPSLCSHVSVCDLVRLLLWTAVW